MVIIKRLYTFMLQQFLPLLMMTFFICLFIVLMQFLWRYIDDLVGKGLSITVIAELFYYAALTMVPTALPLAILLASLMTFGNLGEKFELTALKAAGISLFNIMKPLVVLMVFIAIAAFFFQNNVLPYAQTKMYTLLFSMRQKTPEVEIPVRSFYDQIPGMNLYVERKNPETGMLYDLIIYDMSGGTENSSVILADSGKLNFTEDRTHLFLHLYKGENYGNLPNSLFGSGYRKYKPFGRQSFQDKQVYYAFDANFNRMNDSIVGNQYVGKNLAELRTAIDSIGEVVDSIGDNFVTSFKVTRLVGAPSYQREYADSGRSTVLIPPKQVPMDRPLNVDSIFSQPSPTMARQYVTQALYKAEQVKSSYGFQSEIYLHEAQKMRRHEIEMLRKFTLPVACLIFFFIGAPLGAIIKKGGIGTPLVISVFLFIFYYIVDNTGYKLARDGKIDVWLGIWLSTIVLTPLGAFFTYKAVGDSAVFDVDSYVRVFRRFFGRHERRSLDIKEVIIVELQPERAVALIDDFLISAQQVATGAKGFFNRLFRRKPLRMLSEKLNDMVAELSNSRDKRVIGMLNNYPVDLNYRQLDFVIENSFTIRSFFTPEVFNSDPASGPEPADPEADTSTSSSEEDNI